MKRASPPPHAFSFRRLTQAGFSLVEAMMVVAIMGVLAALAVPNFASLIAKLRVDAAVVTFANSLHFARNEALSRNRSVLVCRMAIQSAPDALPTCDASTQTTPKKTYAANDWAAGWVVYLPASSSSADLNAPAQVLQVVAAPHWALSMELPQGLARLRFTPLGTLASTASGAAADIAIVHRHDVYPVSHDALRCLSSAGRLNKPAAGGCG